MLGRETDWRQGSVLSDDYAKSLGLADPQNDKARIIVVSHDCDLPNQQESNVEVILGTIVDKPDPQYIGARHPRKMHLKLNSVANGALYVELSHLNCIKLEKSKLIEVGGLDQTITIDHDEKRALKQWLAARYGRPAFPNSFETRLRKTCGKKTVESQIGKIFSVSTKHVIGAFFDLDSDRDNELVEDEPYFLKIIIVYDAVEGGPEVRQIAESLAAQVTELFSKAYSDDLNKIILEKCTALADTAFTLADLRKVDQWRLEYISLSNSDNGDFIEVGTI